MTSIHPTVFYLMIESLIVLILISGFIVFLFLKQHRDRKNNLSKLVDTLTHSAKRRKDELSHLLSNDQAEKCDTNDEEVKNKILNQETALYQYMIRLMLAKDQKILLELDHQVEELTNTIITACKENFFQSVEKQTTKAPAEMLPPATSDEINQIRNDILKLHKKNDLLLTTMQDLSLRENPPQKRHVNNPESDDENESVNQIEDLDTNDAVMATSDDTTNNDSLDEQDPTSSVTSDIDEIIDISDNSLDTQPKKEEPPVAEASPQKDISDIDALLEEARTDNTASEIEEIPDDLLQNDEPPISDAATDIDALFAEVAKENIAKSAQP